jgi:CBS domain-containing protein
MQAAIKHLLALTAADLMTAPVTTIPSNTSLREAARLLRQGSITGAPVVDAEGRCVGVLSSSDFVTWAGKGGDAEKGEKRTSFIAPWGEIISLDDSPGNEVGRYMTSWPITAAPTTPIRELTRKMVDAHIHRVLVVVDQDRPVGIVSSTDILAAVAHADRTPPRRRAKGEPPRGS